jgi:hypothetical protein
MKRIVPIRIVPIIIICTAVVAMTLTVSAMPYPDGDEPGGDYPVVDPTEYTEQPPVYTDPPPAETTEQPPVYTEPPTEPDTQAPPETTTERVVLCTTCWYYPCRCLPEFTTAAPPVADTTQPTAWQSPETNTTVSEAEPSVTQPTNTESQDTTELPPGVPPTVRPENEPPSPPGTMGVTGRGSVPWILYAVAGVLLIGIAVATPLIVRGIRLDRIYRY